MRPRHRGPNHSTAASVRGGIFPVHDLTSQGSVRSSGMTNFTGRANKLEERGKKKEERREEREKKKEGRRKEGGKDSPSYMIELIAGEVVVNTTCFHY